MEILREIIQLAHILPKSILEADRKIGGFPYLTVKKSVHLLMKYVVHKGQVRDRNGAHRSQVYTEMHVRVLACDTVGDTC